MTEIKKYNMSGKFIQIIKNDNMFTNKSKNNSAPYRFKNISKKVAVLAQHFEQLEHLGFPLAVLVRGVRVHDVVQAASRARAHLAHSNMQYFFFSFFLCGLGN